MRRGALGSEDKERERGRERRVSWRWRWREEWEVFSGSVLHQVDMGWLAG